MLKSQVRYLNIISPVTWCGEYWNYHDCLCVCRYKVRYLEGYDLGTLAVGHLSQEVIYAPD